MPEQKQDLEDRLNLLTEENQILFEQCEGYKIQLEAIAKSYEDQMKKVGDKLAKYDELEKEREVLIEETKQAKEQIEILKQKLEDLAAKVNVNISIEWDIRSRDIFKARRYFTIINRITNSKGASSVL